MFGLDNLIDMLFETAMEGINRNERVIQLLKRFNLDPDHPPADFTGVYQYALVEYGVGKPRPVLEIFRQTKIQTLFREALEHNTPSILLKNGEDFLADHPLQVDLQANNIDVRREFYAFAAVFIEVAKRTRTPAEILAEQKLESLHRQIGSLQERLNRLPTIEGMRTEMARLAAQDYPALTGSAIAPETFSAERCKAFALAQQMRGWFETLGYRFETHEVWEADYFEWIINVSVWRSRYIRILVRGVDGEVGLADVSALRQSVETHKTDEGWLVTARRIARAARDDVAKPENEHLGCYTLDELLDQDADFSGYLTWLEQEIQKRGIDQKYVPLACIKEEVDPATRQRIGVSRYGDRDGWIDGYIDLWLDDPAKEHISVLGEFGTGKTWFAFHYAWKALQRYREAQRRGLERPRLPLVVPLRDYAKAVSVESLFSEFFFRKHEIPIPGYSAFEQLNRMGKLLLIFDGFDEMAARVDRQQMINNFWELAKVVVPGAKVILTCRTEHFPEAKEGRALLNAELQASTKDLTGETPQFEVLELEKFNDKQIREVLSHQAQPATVEQIMENPELLDLARRPVLTELILEALPDIEAGKPVDMSRVYLYAVRHKMERDIKAERTFTSMADKLYFMCELSWEMLSTDRMSINYREFPDRIRSLFGPVVEEEKDLDHWHYDMMGQTMLIRNAEGDYTPAHRSLLEFFVAYKFAAELGALASDFTELAKTRPHLDTEIKLKNYKWSDYFYRDKSVNTVSASISVLGNFTGETIENLRFGFGRQLLTKAVIDLLTFMLIEYDENSIHPLLEMLHHTRDKDAAEVDFVGGNAATLLIKLDKCSLKNRDLKRTLIKGADFTNANLENTDFSGANLANSSFTNTFVSVHSLAFKPDQDILAAGDANGQIRIWSIKENKHLLSLRGHDFRILSVAFSKDGNFFASGSADRLVKIWNAQTGKCLKILEGHTDRILSVCFSPDGTLLASGSYDSTIRIWDTKAGRCVRIIKGHRDRVLSVVFNPNKPILASGSEDKSVYIWNANTGQTLASFNNFSDGVRSVCWHPNGSLLACGNKDRCIYIWDIEKQELKKTLQGHTGGVISVSFSPNGNTIASSSKDERIKLWNAETGKCLLTLEDHNAFAESVAFSPNGKILASGSHDQTIKLWDTDTGICLKTSQGYGINWIWSVAFSFDSQRLLCGGNYFSGVWDIKTGKCLKVLEGHEGRVWSVAFNPSANIAATGSDDGTIKLWNIDSWECVQVLKKHARNVRAICFSPNGSFLASCSSDRTIKLWNVRHGICIDSLVGSSHSIHSVSFSPDGQFIASGDYSNSVKIWDIHTGKTGNSSRRETKTPFRCV